MLLLLLINFPIFPNCPKRYPDGNNASMKLSLLQSWLEAVGMMSGLKELFFEQSFFIRDLFKKHVVAQGNTGGITSVSEAEALFRQLHPPRKAHPSFSGRKAERKEPDAE